MYNHDIEFRRKIEDSTMSKQEIREILLEMFEKIESAEYRAEQAYNDANEIEEWS